MKQIVQKIKKFDYFIFFKIICILGLLTIFLLSAIGCITVRPFLEQEQKRFEEDFDRHQPEEKRG